MDSAKRMKYGYRTTGAAEQALFVARSPLMKMLAAVSVLWLTLSLCSAYMLITNISIYRSGGVAYLRLLADPCIVNIMYLLTPANTALACIATALLTVGVAGHILVAVGKYKAVAAGLILRVAVDISIIAITPVALLTILYLTLAAAYYDYGNGLLIVCALFISCLALLALTYAIVTLVRTIALRIRLAKALLNGRGARKNSDGYVSVHSSPLLLLRAGTVFRTASFLFTVYAFMYSAEYRLPLAFMLVTLALSVLSIIRFVIRSVLFERFRAEAQPINMFLFIENNSVSAQPTRTATLSEREIDNNFI